MKTKEEKCEWIPCKEEAKHLCASQGRLLNLCNVHKKALNKQHKILERSGY
jgi:hypothetical protein